MNPIPTSVPQPSCNNCLDKPLTREWAWLLALFCLALVMYSAGMGRTGFQGKDELRYAQVSKEVGPGPDLFVLHFCGELYPDKPPILFWSLKLSYWLMNQVTPLSARMPLLVYTLLALGLAWLTMRQMFGPRLALLGMAMLMLSFRFFWAGRWLRLDMPLVAFTFGAFWASARLLFPRPGQRTAGWGWAVLAWAFATLATLTKGTGLPVWFGTILTYAAWRRDWGVLRRFYPWLGIPVAVAIAAAWLVPAWIHGGREYLGAMVGFHIVQRYVGEIDRHGHWFGYFFTRIIADAQPAATLLPVALWWAWKRRRTGPEQDQLVFLLAWIGFTMLFFSIPSAKRGQYILPMYPAVMMCVAWFIREALREPGERAHRLLCGHLWVWAVLLPILGMAPYPLFLAGADEFGAKPSLVMVGVMALAGILGGAMAIRGLRRRNPVPVLWAIGLALAIGHTSLFASYFPRQQVDTYRKEIAAHIDRAMPEGAVLGHYGFSRSPIVYGNALPKLLETTETLRLFMTRPGGQWLLMGERFAIEKQQELTTLGWQPEGTWPDPGGRFPLVLLRHRSTVAE